ncbi:MAG: hypothetical protein WDW38_001269 [Sanguina aurantia]
MLGKGLDTFSWFSFSCFSSNDAYTEDAQEAAAPVQPSVDYEKILSDVKTKWDGVDNKPAVAAYTAGSVVSVFLSITLVSAINSVPVLPKFLELVGLVYSSWFTYRYLLFKTSREELAKDINELKQKISGKGQ